LDFNPPNPDAPGGGIELGDHYDPCKLFPPGEQLVMEFVCPPEGWSE
jgi:hypothetical protein